MARQKKYSYDEYLIATVERLRNSKKSWNYISDIVKIPAYALKSYFDNNFRIKFIHKDEYDIGGM